MPRILIVEDEPFEREALKEQVTKTYRAENVYLASSIEEAVDIIDKKIPDLIILDIKLKGKSGLEIARYVKEHYREIKIIIVTAYNKFEYAKEALTLNVNNYLSKPVRPSTLIKTINEVLERKNNYTLLWPLLEDGEVDKAKTLLDFKVKSLLVVGFSDITNNIDLYKNYFHFELPDNKLIEIKDNNLIIYMENEVRGPVVTLEKLNKIINEFNEKFNTETVIGIDQNTELMECYKNALAASNHKVFYPLKQLLFYAEIKNNWSNNYSYPVIVEQKMINLLKVKKNEAKHDEALRMMIANIIDSSGMNYSILTTWIATIYNSLKKYCIEENIPVNSIPEIKNIFWFSGSHLQNEFKNFFQQVRKNLDLDSWTMHPIINEAVDILLQNYDQTITLKDLCRKLAISSGYFSRLFKEETGISYRNYLIKVRMEKAKNLLIHGKYSISEVAANVGYSDPNYFSEAFKKYEGISPSKYQETKRAL